MSNNASRRKKRILRKRRHKRISKKIKKYSKKYDYIIFVDGSASGKNKLATAAAVIFDSRENIMEQKAVIVDHATSNQAEYLGLILGLYMVYKLDLKGKVIFYSDSRLLVNQLYGIYKINSKKLYDLFEIVSNFLSPTMSVKWINREHNRAADALAHNALKRNGDTKYMLCDKDFYLILPDWMIDDEEFI